MTLKALANEIAAQAKVEAKAIIAAAKQQAKHIEADAKAEAESTALNLQNRAEKESAQLSVEVVASARQANQKHELIARREELDAAWDSIRAEVASPSLNGRSDILVALLSEASESGTGMILHPVSADRKELSKGNFTLGNDVEGLGGFVLESKDGLIVLDYRFDTRLKNAWTANLGEVNKVLFGN